MPAQGTTSTLVAQFLNFNGGTPVDVAGLTIMITKLSDSSVILAPTSVGIVHVSTGVYNYPWAITVLDPVGDYVVTWQGTVASVPVATSEVITVTPILVNGYPSSDAPCTYTDTGGWAPNVSIVTNWSSFSSSCQQYATNMATSMMWTATGRRFGPCIRTVRPCWNPPMPTYMTYPAIWNAGQYGGQYAWGLYAFAGTNGLLAGCGCGTDSCACEPPEITLPTITAQITNVTINGVTLDPTAYRLDGRKLVRQDGQAWPYRQDLSKALGGTNTWSITYLEGEGVPQAVNDAAGVLAGEVAKMCAGQPCAFSKQVTSVSRQGVTASYPALQDLITRGMTGIYVVDMVVRSYNPNGLIARPRLISQDLPKFREVTS